MNKTISENNTYCAHLAKTELIWNFRFPDTAGYLRKWLSVPTEGTRGDVIRVTDAEFVAWERCGNAIDGFAEFCLLCEQSSEYLLRQNRCIFHAAAVSFHGRAWLIAAGSGVGKSTQCRNLTELWPGEFSVINGDKPALEAREDGTIFVHPSPWTGKEGWHGAEAAPLGGLILLRRGEKNEIVPIEKKLAAPRVLSSIFQSWQDEEVLRLCAAMAEKILKAAPTWLLTSCEVPDSTRLLYDVMRREAEKNEL